MCETHGSDSTANAGVARQATGRPARTPALGCLMAVVWLGAAAHASSQTGLLDLDGGGVRYAVYAPEWIWQQQHVNIIVVFENERQTPSTVRAELVFPSVNPPAFHYGDSRTTSVVLAPGERGRIAFANILARDRITIPLEDGAEGEGVRTVKVRTDDGAVRVEKVRDVKVDPGRFVFTIELQAHSDGTSAVASVPYPVTTVRGGAVREGPAAQWLPVLLILGWCGLIFLIVPRMARPGAWRLPSEPFEVPEADGSRRPAP